MAPATPLKNARLKNNLSRRFVAIELDVTEGTVMRWEQGRTYPRADQLMRLARMYRRRPEELVVVAA